ncbi:MAG: hypothetical protein HFE45_01120 [Oscillospiraceae bacterium]|nr:hypothetical protein [Oscillospiraceae bacterium]
MKRLSAIMMVAMLMLLLPGAAYAAKGTVSDRAEALTSAQRQELLDSASYFVDSFGLDMAIIFEEVEGSLYDAAADIYEQRGVGGTVGEEVGGVLLLVDPVDADMVVYSDGGAAEIFNDIWADSFLTSCGSLLSQGDFYGIANAFVDTAVSSCSATAETMNQALAAPILSNGEGNIDLSQKIYDFADLLTDSEEQKLKAEAREFSSLYGLDLALVTTYDAEGKSSMAYADDFYDYNGFGLDDSKSGLLLLVDMENRVVWLSTTGSAIELFTDARIKEITDGAASYLANGDYFGGCSSAFAAISDTVRTDREMATVSGRAMRSARRLPFYLMGAAAVSGIAVAVMARQSKTARKARNAAGYLDQSSIRLLVRDDQFIRSSVARTKIETSSGGGRGGSSTHTGSSGTRHGGGGSRF